MTENSTPSPGVSLRAVANDRLGRHRFRMALRRGDLVPLWPRIVVERGCLAKPETLAASAILSIGKGAVIVGETAAFLHGCQSVRPTPIHVLVPYTRSPKPRRGITIHQGRLEPDDIVIRDGLPLAAFDHVLADILCTVGPRRALACVDEALRLCPEELRMDLKRNIGGRLDARPDRRGTQRAAALLHLADGSRESPAESSVRLIIHDSGFPEPESQYTIRNIDGKELYRLDFAWSDQMIALEYDGYAAHESRAAHDAAREQDLVRRGWRVIRASAGDLADPTRLVAELRCAFDDRLSGRR